VGAPRAPRRTAPHGRRPLIEFDWARLSAPFAGRFVRLESVRPEHEPGLWEAARDRRIWDATHLEIRTREDFGRWMDDALDEQARRIAAPFVTCDAESGGVLGSTRYGSLRPEHRSLEIGWTWLNPAAWGTGANVEAKLLMLTRAFEELGCIRVEFKTNARNERSRAALAALPAQFEGIHRKHMIVRDGELRDSAWYSVLDDEWPAVKANLERRLRFHLAPES
jgi:RimJ/RimL family protein N-acetyltransferase